MLEIQDIRRILNTNSTLPVYQLSIIDFLNKVKRPEDISGPEFGSGPIKDDPRKSGRGYDIGVKVARRILKRRKSLGGQFSNLDQLAGIPYFGPDKLHDLVYTFMTFRSPIPTGLGQQFDNYILALGRLEMSAMQTGMSTSQTLSAIRKIFFSKNIGQQADGKNVKMDWDKVIPRSKSTNIPSVWAVRTELLRSMDTIKSYKTIQIGHEPINIQLLISTLDALTHPDKVSTGNNKIKLDSNVNVAGFTGKIASATYQYLSPKSIRASSSFKVDQAELNQVYDNNISLAEFAAIADARNMEYDPSLSLSWNLLNYYTAQKKPSENRYQALAEALNLGTFEDGILDNDNNQTRTILLDQIHDTNFFLLKENGKTQLVNRMLRNGEADGAFMAYRIASAFTLDLFLDRLLILISLELNQPSIISWNRLEARPRTEDFSRTLKAEVRDALWFISRQWQFGEFSAEDSGSALEMRVDMQTSEVDQFSLRGGPVQTYDSTIPMETTVERESVAMDLTIRQETGRQFERLLQTKLAAAPNSFIQNTIDKIIGDFRAASNFQFSLPTPAEAHPDIYSNPSLLKNYVAISNGRMLDGGAIYQTIKDGTPLSTFVTSTSSVNALAKVDQVAQQLLDWFERVYSQPDTAADSAWNPKQLEYQFQCSAASSNSTRSILTTDEYANGHLDWYSFDFENNARHPLNNRPVDSNKINRKLITVLPTDLKYPGMPLARWWQFEDFKVDLGNIKANTNEIPKLLMTEFALIYSNDWMLMPFDVPVGSLCEIKSVVVRDVFGQYTSVNAAGSGDNSDWQRWSMFNLNRRRFNSGPADTRLFVPPAVVRTMESDPLEQIGLLRDEMANMVWGIEKMVPNGMGGSMDGNQAGRRLYDYLASITPETTPPTPPLVNDASIQYQLGTTVPENWIPFIPVRMGGVNGRQIQLRRAAMPRIIRGRTPERVRPRTELLKTGYDASTNSWGPYFLHEEEVPRSGVIVRRSWQRSRWMNGKNFTWLGRRVGNGRGEANSGLEFDRVVEKE